MGKMIKYVVERGVNIPLCAIKDDIYFDYLSGQVIDNESTIKWIEKCLKRKSAEIKELDLAIYEIGMINNKSKFISHAYNFVYFGCSNYLDLNKQPLNDYERHFVKNKLMLGDYIERLIWGEE